MVGQMRIEDTSTPVLVICCKIGGMGLFRSLGSLGIPVYGVDNSPFCKAVRSRYCKRHWVKTFDGNNPQDYLEFLLGLGRELGKGTVLIPTSDELSEFVSEFGNELSEYFVFQHISLKLIERIVSKKGMFGLAKECEVPTPNTLFPESLEDVKKFSDEVAYPVMLKGIHGDKLEKRTGIKMEVVHDREELIKLYEKYEDPDDPNLMIQEFIPGGDDEVYIFNGYFNKDSDCLTAYTGHKIRQYPIHKGCSSLGICTWIEDFSELNKSFMKRIGYFGILDIGYRLDPRDGLYKVLDINPRIGGAFRMFISENGMDVARSLYLDLTGQEQQSSPAREGRKWIIEDYDIIASFHYMLEGSLGPLKWLRSFHRVEEVAWFNWRDPMPSVLLYIEFLKKFLMWVLKKTGLRRLPKAEKSISHA